MELDEENLRELLVASPLADQTVNIMLQAIEDGAEVKIVSESKPTLTIRTKDALHEFLTNNFGWKGQPAERREVSDAFKEKADEGSQHGEAKKA